MNKQAEINRILATIGTMEYSQLQSIDVLLEYGFKLAGWVAFSAEAMAEAKEILHKTRSEKYKTTLQQLQKDGKKPAPSILKDYINDKCYAEHSYYELCERTNRAATHSIELVRTAVSALKQDRYSGSFTP